MNRFILIDGNAILHRAFHALPPLTSKSGEIVNAVYGFFSMFLKIIEDVKPTHIAVCFDRPKPTFRQILYAGYQAKRPKMDEDLVPQIEVVHEILKKGKVQIFEIDGYEADDLIGTLSVQALAGPVARHLAGTRSANKPLCASKASDSRHPQALLGEEAKGVSSNEARGDSLSEAEVIIVSGDRDMLQLVNHHVKVLAPVVGITNMVLYDSAKVEEKYGIKPYQIIDYKALVGDSSDNYPGVSGIGPKTAKELLQKFGSLEEIYDYLNRFTTRQTHVSRPARQTQSKPQGETRSLSERRQKINTLLEENSESSFSCLESGLTRSQGQTFSLEVLSPKIAEKLSIDAEQAALCKKLATIVTDAPVTLDIDKCFVEKINKRGIRESFEELGFKSLLKRVQSTEDREQKTDNGKTEKTDKNGQLGLL